MELFRPATQTCRTCRETKPVSEFDLRADTGRQRTVCKECRRRYQNDRSRRVASLSPRMCRVVGSSEVYRCLKCGEIKPAAEFPTRPGVSRRHHTWCRSCFSLYKAARHQRLGRTERERIKRTNRLRAAASRAKIIAYLQEHPCVDCGEKDTVVLDFDHVRGEKVANVSSLVNGGYPWATIQAEIEKCDVRCANDHRRATKRRREERRVAGLPAVELRPRGGSNARPAVP